MFSFIRILVFTILISGQVFPGNTRNSFYSISDDESKWIDSVISEMNLFEKCAQLIMPHVLTVDTNLNSDYYKNLETLVSRWKVGGFIFFQGTIENQIKVINKLKSLSNIPLLISADYERGVGMRLDGAVEFPYAMALGATNNPELTYRMAEITAIESEAVGVNFNLAPLVDINRDFRNPIINIRSYSEDPNIVSWHSSSYINAMNKYHILTAAKHFPGHGATDSDSHNELPVITLSKKKLLGFDILPFKSAITSGVKSIMIGHLKIPNIQLDESYPATFSKNIIQDFLKSDLKFKGLVITDAMNMHAITENFTDEEAAVNAINAGNDIILFPNNVMNTILGIYSAVQRGDISKSRIDYSVRKILAAKIWAEANNSEINIDSSLKILGNPHHKNLAYNIAAKSITLLKDDDHILPIAPNDYKKAISISLSNSKIKKSLDEEYEFERLLKSSFKKIRIRKLNQSSRLSKYNSAYRAAKNSDLIIISTYVSVKAFSGVLELDKNQLRLIKNLIKLKKPILFLNFGNPYLIREFQNIPTYLCSFGEVNFSQQAMFDAILGRISITGRLPISITDTKFHIGYGLSLPQQKPYFPTSEKDSTYNFKVVNDLMSQAINDSVFPGAVLFIGHKNRLIYKKSWGKFSFDSNSIPMTQDAIFDLASLTKVVATTTAVMKLVDQNIINLDDKVFKYLPKFFNNGKSLISIRHLLTHSSGLPAFKPYYKFNADSSDIISDIFNSPLKFKPGSKYLYSDLGMIVLQQLVERVTAKTLDNYLENEIFSKIEMHDTFFNPDELFYKRCVPTEKDNYYRHRLLKGEVHDETASLLNGVAGHAGLFSTAADLSKFCFMLLNDGFYGVEKILSSNVIRDFTTKQSTLSSRALGWDTPSPKHSSAGTKFSKSSFGHTGFTGTSIWIDPSKDLFVILLSNRINPTRLNTKIIEFRPRIHDAIMNEINYIY